ncbi:hypothetical protein GQ54DRAFT_324830 [Martensiomyces pterosporus]|nr:hypothetical protein GQ54DRAFT_324830 [Martensiomyces pterosporus]
MSDPDAPSFVPPLAGTDSSDQFVALNATRAAKPSWLNERGDNIVIGFGFGAYGLTLLLILYAWVNHSYRPIRAKNLVLITLMFFMAVPWYLSSIVTNGLVDLVGPWKLCKLWGIWFRIAASDMYVSILLFRAYLLDRIFLQHKPSRGWGHYWPAIALTLALLLFCTVGQVVSDSRTIIYIEKMRACHYITAFRYSALGVTWFITLMYAIQIIRIRHIKSSFNEFRENLIIFLIIFATTLQLTLLGIFVSLNPFVAAIRLATTCFDFVSGNLVLWILLAHPVFMCMFRRREYEKMWLRKLAADGLAREYGVQEGEGVSTGSYSRMGEVSGSTERRTEARTHLDQWYAHNEPGSQFNETGSSRMLV